MCIVVKEQLLADLLFYQIGIAIVSETKLKGKHSVEFSCLAGYRVHRRDRLGRGGGGVGIYVSEAYSSAVLNITGVSKTFELLLISVKSQIKTFLVGALYHQPKYKLLEGRDLRVH